MSKPEPRILGCPESIEHLSASDEVDETVKFKNTTGKGSVIYENVPIRNGILNFKVRADHDAHIALSTGPTMQSTIFEVIFDSLGFTSESNHSTFRNCIKKYSVHDSAIIKESPKMLNGNEFRGFWVKWDEKTISVGVEGLTKSFLEWSDNELSSVVITHVGVLTHDSVIGTWIVEDGWEFNTPNKYEYLFAMLNSGFLEFEFKGEKECYVNLRTGQEPIYTIYLGSYNNEFSGVIFNHQDNFKAEVKTPDLLSPIEYRKFRIMWSCGNIKALKGDGSLIFDWKAPIVNEPINFITISKSLKDSATADARHLKCSFGKIAEYHPTVPFSTCPYMWLSESDGKLPPNALSAGLSPDTRMPLYVVRAKIDKKIWIIGSLEVPNHWADFNWKNKREKISKYEVLVAGEAWSKRADLWVRTQGAVIPVNAMVAGMSDESEELYVGRVINDDGSVCVGWVSRSAKGCNFINIENVSKKTTYDILCN